MKNKNKNREWIVSHLAIGGDLLRSVPEFGVGTRVQRLRSNYRGSKVSLSGPKAGIPIVFGVFMDSGLSFATK